MGFEGIERDGWQYDVAPTRRGFDLFKLQLAVDARRCRAILEVLAVMCTWRRGFWEHYGR
jgi:hypothetical protein